MHTFLLPTKGHLRKKCLKTVTLYIWHSLHWKNPLKSCGFLQLLDLRASRYLSTVFATSFVQLQTSHAGSPPQKRSIRWCINGPNPRKPPKIKDLSNQTCLKISIPRKFQVKPLALGRFCSKSVKQLKFSEHFHVRLPFALLFLPFTILLLQNLSLSIILTLRLFPQTGGTQRFQHGKLQKTLLFKLWTKMKQVFEGLALSCCWQSRGLLSSTS